MMTGPLHQQRVLITGAAVRLGRAMALGLARTGATVAVHYHNSEAAAEKLLAELLALSPGHVTVKADLRSSQERNGLIPGLLEQGFQLNALINNASVYRRMPLLRITPESFAADYEINFWAPFQLMQEFARHCHDGCIINLLDQRVATVDACAGAYGLAKKTLRDVTEAAAVQWAPRIRVNGIAPGFVLPPPGVAPEKMNKFLATIPMGRASAPEEVADACLFLLRSTTITGQILFIDGGLHLSTGPTLGAEVDETPARQ